VRGLVGLSAPDFAQKSHAAAAGSYIRVSEECGGHGPCVYACPTSLLQAPGLWAFTAKNYGSDLDPLSLTAVAPEATLSALRIYTTCTHVMAYFLQASVMPGTLGELWSCGKPGSYN